VLQRRGWEAELSVRPFLVLGTVEGSVVKIPFGVGAQLITVVGSASFLATSVVPLLVESDTDSKSAANEGFRKDGAQSLAILRRARRTLAMRIDG
jgi:hypothetical protein